MAIHIRRREFICALGSAAAWPIAASTQQRSLPLVGFLHSGSAAAFARSADAFRHGLADAGFMPEQNVLLEYRWADGQFERLPAMAADLVRLHVAVMFAGGPPATLAAKAATSTIPVVFAMGDDPIASGIVPSLSRPGGNVTGATFFTVTLGKKRLELLSELVPNATVFAMIVNPKSPNAELQVADAQAAARALGRDLHIYNVSTEAEISSAFSSSLPQLKPNALLVGTDPFLTGQRARIAALAAEKSFPAMYSLREYVLAGGLISYGARADDGYHIAGLYTGRVLKGEKPADLPVVQPTKFELVINLKTAKALGLTVPLIMQMTADEVIE